MPLLTDLDPADFLRLVDRRRTNTALLTYRPGTVLPGQSVSRTTVATYFDANGIAQQAPVNGLRDAHYIGGRLRTNLAVQSNNYTSGAWINANVTATAAATTGPLGAVDGWKLDDTAVNSNHTNTQNPAVTPGQYTVSRYFKSAEYTKAIIYIDDAGGASTSYEFDLIALTATQKKIPSGIWSGVSASITDVGGGWRRCSVTGTTTASVFGTRVGAAPNGVSYDAFGLPTYLGVVGQGIYTFGHQVEAGGLSAYVPTGASAASVFDGGVRTTLLEGSRTNSCLWSRDLTNAAWGTAGSAKATAAQNAVGLDGTANSATTLTDSDAVNFQGTAQTTPITNDGATHALSVWIKKDTDQTRFPVVELTLQNGTTPVTVQVSVNTQTGAKAMVSGTTARVVDAGLWWVVEVTALNNTSGNTLAVWRFYPAAGIGLGGFSGAATGSCVVGQVQVELNSTFASSPVFTTTTAVNRAADLVTAGAGLAPLTPFTVLYKVIELGTGFVNSARYFQLGNNAAAASFNVKGTGGGAPMPELYNGGFVSIGGPVAHVLGDVLEIRATLDAAGGWSISQSINGAAETAQFTAAYGSFPGALSANLASMSIDGGGGTGFHALLSMKIARGVRSLAAMRSL